MIFNYRNNAALTLSFALCACATSSTTNTAAPLTAATGMPLSNRPLPTAQSTQTLSGPIKQNNCVGIKRDLSEPWASRQYWCVKPDIDNAISVASNQVLDAADAAITTVSNAVQGLVKNYKLAVTWIEESYQSAQNKDWAEAIKAASVAIVLDPNNSSAYVNRSWAYAESGLLDQAIADGNFALKLDANNALAFNNRGYALELSGRMAEAAEDYRFACNMRYQAACDTLTQFASITPNKAPDEEINTLLDQSFASFNKRNWHKVEELSTKVLFLDPNNAIAYVNRAGARTELGNHMNAIADSNKAIRLAPEMGIAYNNNGYAHEKLGQLGYASHYYDRACRLGVAASCLDYDRVTTELATLPNIRAEALY